MNTITVESVGSGSLRLRGEVMQERRLLRFVRVAAWSLDMKIVRLRQLDIIGTYGCEMEQNGLTRN